MNSCTFSSKDTVRFTDKINQNQYYVSSNLEWYLDIKNFGIEQIHSLESVFFTYRDYQMIETVFTI